MICPYCDSRVKDLPDNHVCPYCGGLLKNSIQHNSSWRQNLRFPEPPVGVYKANAGHIEIGEDSVSFFRRIFFKSYSCTIPFYEIYRVSYGEGERMRSGFLCVREWQDRRVPLITIPNDAVLDKTSVYFDYAKNEEFRKAYEFLKKCADIVNAADPEKENVLTSLWGRYKELYGYMEMGPDGLIFYKKVLGVVSERVIPYEEIAEVAIREARPTCAGGLSVRHREDRGDLADALENAAVNETSISFYVSGNEQMGRVYAFLTERVRENVKRWSQSGK